MVVFYNKTTGKIYGTLTGFDPKEIMIKPSDVDEGQVDKMIIDARFENKYPDTIRNITSYKVVKGKLAK